MDPISADRRLLPRVLLRALCVPGGFAAGAVAVLALAPLVVEGPAQPDVAPPVVALEGTRDAAAARADVLVERHGCWVGEAPASERGRLPGHVVLTRLVAGREVTAYAGERAVGQALDHLFTRPDPAVVAVHGFCR